MKKKDLKEAYRLLSSAAENLKEATELLDKNGIQVISDHYTFQLYGVGAIEKFAEVTGRELTRCERKDSNYKDDHIDIGNIKVLHCIIEGENE